MEGEAGVHNSSDNLRTIVESGVNIDVTDIVVGGEIGAFP